MPWSPGVRAGRLDRCSSKSCFDQRTHSPVPKSKALADTVKLDKDEPQIAQASSAVASTRIPDHELTDALEDREIHGNDFRVDRDHELGLRDRLDSLIGRITAGSATLVNSWHFL